MLGSDRQACHQDSVGQAKKVAVQLAALAKMVSVLQQGGILPWTGWRALDFPTEVPDRPTEVLLPEELEPKQLPAAATKEQLQVQLPVGATTE